MATTAEESKTYAAAAGHSGLQLGGPKRNPKEGTRATPSKQKVSRALFWRGSALRQIFYRSHTWESRVLDQYTSKQTSPTATTPSPRGIVTPEHKGK